MNKKLLDPVSSELGMSGRIGEIRKDNISRDENIDYVHSDDSVALFAYDNLFREEAA